MQNNKTETPEKNTEGLPDIGSQMDVKKRNVVAVFFIGLCLFVGLMAHKIINPTNTKKEIPVSEDYTPENKVLPKTSVNNVHETIQQEPQRKAGLSENEQALLLSLEKERLARLQAPVMLINNTSHEANKSLPKKATSADSNTTFMAELSTQEDDIIQASTMKNRPYSIAEGTLIPGIMETAINSDLPGMVRAIVAEPVYSEDGNNTVIEAGSRLIGQYKSGMQQGQSRVFVVWTTLIQPSGSRIRLNSPGVDNLGVSGNNADVIDRHFLERFGNAALLSIIGAGAANIGVDAKDGYNAKQAYRQALYQSFNEAANNAYKQTASIAPTLHIEQGTPILVFVSHTLDFSKTVKETQKKRSVF